MPQFKLHFHTDNAAFDEPGRSDEVIRILKMVISQIEMDNEGEGENIHDINGNTIGAWHSSIPRRRK